MATTEWLRRFNEIRMDFESSRQCPSGVVRITFRDGVSVFAASMKAGPGDEFLTIDVYPPAPPEGMVRDHEGLLRTATSWMVPLQTIRRIELLTEAPAPPEAPEPSTPRTLGFGAVLQAD